jgi:hypothetical protein
MEKKVRAEAEEQINNLDKKKEEASMKLKELKSKTGKAWSLLVDTGKELPQTAKAANTVCFACKTTDTVLRWPYMGDPHPATDLKRGGNPAAVEMTKKYIQNPVGCIHCHDPHATKPRVVRDA